MEFAPAAGAAAPVSAAGPASGATGTQAANATAVAVVPIRLSISRRIILYEVILGFSLITRKGDRYVC
jgi:hypothetical protein